MTLNFFNQCTEALLALKEMPERFLTDPIGEGKWSIREIIGHLYFGDLYNLEEMVPLMADGVSLPPFPNHNEHNEKAISYIKRFETVSDLLGTFAQTRQLLIQALEKVGKEAQFEIENEPGQYTVESFVDLFAKHDAHHLKQIQLKLKGQALHFDKR
ncbi:DinB family protein [Pullulanibacillus sp. KACC 23026]|uniref:DinB family protein n=1 Tax=Pullulanibacillus sp. KACC 23026 TaxID=3028315 RepID=UPI0023B14084|nr:DinB family protein [Pullulanibacillus sp. KACC 23026]WEG10901.1 DinB family protein [Pullulanibacillus sp. KACC 23026]